MKNKKRLMLGGVGLSMVGVLIAAYFYRNTDWKYINPLGIGKVEEKKEMKVIGFLPPWNITKTNIKPKELDELIFLGVEVDEKGKLVWDTQSRKINNKVYLEMKETMKKWGKKNVVGFKLFEDNKLTKLLGNEEYIDYLIREIEAVVLAGNFDGVNIDFEYQGDPVAILNEGFFELLSGLKKADVGEVSVDVFCNTLIKGESEKLKRLWNLSDNVIVMAYDFTRPGVDYTGSVAPIKSPAGKRSIWETISRAVDLGLDMKKLITAYPLYGYEWKTETNEFESKIIRGWYQTASLGRIKELLKENKEIVRNWDELSMTPWLVWKEDDTWRQIYYDDEASLLEKFKLSMEVNAGGVGFWALGYEGDSKIWEVVEETMK